MDTFRRLLKSIAVRAMFVIVALGLAYLLAILGQTVLPLLGFPK